jgi:methylated-DNA-[protein]-cysteine S-methyltransferase
MPARHFCLFPTDIGACAIAWGEGGIVGLQLPERRELRTRARMLRRFPSAMETSPPEAVQRTIDRIVTLLKGERTDLSDVPLDMEGVPEFNRRVYDIARRVPPGGTISYGDIANRLGDPGSARAVGQALGSNPFRSSSRAIGSWRQAKRSAVSRRAAER